MEELLLSRLGAVCATAARSYFSAEVAPSEFEQLLRPLLGSPRNMWLAWKGGLVTREEMIDFIGGHLHTFLLHRLGEREPDPLLVAPGELRFRIGEALDSIPG